LIFFIAKQQLDHLLRVQISSNLYLCATINGAYVIDKYKPGISKNQPNYFLKNMDHNTINVLAASCYPELAEGPSSVAVYPEQGRLSTIDYRLTTHHSPLTTHHS